MRVRVSPSLSREFPGLAVHGTLVEGAARRSPRVVRDQLRALSDRWGGARAVELRRQPVPWAYRVFYRHIGLDPDDTPTPVEELVRRRIQEGRFSSGGLVADAVAIATVETSVAVRAFSAGAMEGEVTLRTTAAGERIGSRAKVLPAGALVFADLLAPIAEIFGPAVERAEPGRRREPLLLLAIQVPGVPEVLAEEALWRAAGVLESVG